MSGSFAQQLLLRFGRVGEAAKRAKHGRTQTGNILPWTHSANAAMVHCSDEPKSYWSKVQCVRVYTRDQGSDSGYRRSAKSPSQQQKYSVRQNDLEQRTRGDKITKRQIGTLVHTATYLTTQHSMRFMRVMFVWMDDRELLYCCLHSSGLTLLPAPLPPFLAGRRLDGRSSSSSSSSSSSDASVS